MAKSVNLTALFGLCQQKGVMYLLSTAMIHSSNSRSVHWALKLPSRLLLFRGSSSTLPRTLRANSLHLKDRGKEVRWLPTSGESSVSLVEVVALAASWLIGDECLLEETEDTLLLKLSEAECLRLKNAKAADGLRSRPEPGPDFFEVMATLYVSCVSPGV